MQIGSEIRKKDIKSKIIITYVQKIVKLPYILQRVLRSEKIKA
jgi:hypothetical protein